MKAILKKERAPGIVFDTVPEPANNGDAIVKIEAAAICGSDLHIDRWQGAFDHVKAPVIMGHEACGIIVDPGKTALKEGQRVVVDSVFSCGTCQYCRTGYENLCVNRQTVGQSFDGVFAEYAALPERCCIPLPSSIPAMVGACIEPFGVALHAVENANMCIGDSVAIVGPGPIGIMCMLLCKAAGASPVIMIGTRMDEMRLTLAKQLGADMILYAEDADSLSKIKAATSGMGVKISFDWSGAGSGLRTAFDAVRPSGSLVTGAIYTKPSELSFTDLVRREITLQGSRSRVYGTWLRAIDLLQFGTVDILPIITHQFALDDAQKAFDVAHNREGMKVVFSAG